MKKLFLIGFMGTGKSAVGRVLAKRQGYTCDDLDELIERSPGTTIADYIDSHGEEAFRDVETKMLTDWIDLHSGTAEDNEHKYSVLACGGGVVLREETRKMMRANGLSVRLTASIQSIYQRVSANAPERPNGGRYKKSWRGKAETPAPHRYTYTAYANKDGYRIAHLLENGHLNRDGSRTRAFPHIRPAEKKAEEELIRRLKKAL